jgi:glycosyltransferase involved in cell wall biosynthesis
MFTCHNIHGGIGLDFYRRRVIARNLFKNSADLFQVFSSRDMRQLSSLGIAEDKIRIIPNGVDTHLFQPRLAERSHNTVRIIWFGRIETAKGLIVLLRALKLLKNEARNFELLIGGRVWDEQYYKELLCFKDAAGLQEVRFLGFVENLPNFIREADIFVLPSLWETLPIVILEAMASGLPVVASTVGAVPEVIINNETGYLVPPGDPQALADKLRLLIDDPKLRRTMGNNARRRAESCFSIDDICDSVVKAYHEIM